MLDIYLRNLKDAIMIFIVKIPFLIPGFITPNMITLLSGVAGV